MAHFKPGMTAEAYRAWLDQYNISHEGAARFFGVSRTTSIRWAMAESNIPKMIPMLIELMERAGDSPGPEYQRKKLTIEQHDERERTGLMLLAKGWQERMDERAKKDAVEKEKYDEWIKNNPLTVKK